MIGKPKYSNQEPENKHNYNNNNPTSKSISQPHPQSQPATPTHKPTPKTIDFRNLKYQGEVANLPTSLHGNYYRPNGYGVALDQNYTAVFGEWSMGSYVGHQSCAWVVFGNSEKMYGAVGGRSDGSAGRAEGNVMVYQSQHYKLYIKNDILVVDTKDINNKNYHTLTKLKIINSDSSINNQRQKLKKSTYSNPPPKNPHPKHSQTNWHQKYKDYMHINLSLIEHRSYINPDNNHRDKQKNNSANLYLSYLGEMLEMPEGALNNSITSFGEFLRSNQVMGKFMSVQATMYTPRGGRSSSNSSTGNTNDQLIITCKNIPNTIYIKLSQPPTKPQKPTPTPTHKFHKLSRISYKAMYRQRPKKSSKQSKQRSMEVQELQIEEICRKYQYYANDEGYIVEEYVNCYVGGQGDREVDVFGYVQYQCLQYHDKQAKVYAKGTTNTPTHQIAKQSKKLTQQQYHGRPDKQTHKQCSKNLEQYYKRSLTYQNEYINLNKVYKLQYYCKELFRLAMPIIQFADVDVKKKNWEADHVQGVRQTQNLGDVGRGFGNNGNSSRQEYGNRTKEEHSHEGQSGYFYHGSSIQKEQQYDQQVSIQDIRKQIIKTEMIASRRTRYDLPSSNRFKISNDLYNQSSDNYPQQYNHIAGGIRYRNKGASDQSNSNKYSYNYEQFRKNASKNKNIKPSSSMIKRQNRSPQKPHKLSKKQHPLYANYDSFNKKEQIYGRDNYNNKPQKWLKSNENLRYQYFFSDEQLQAQQDNKKYNKNMNKDKNRMRTRDQDRNNKGNSLAGSIIRNLNKNDSFNNSNGNYLDQPLAAPRYRDSRQSSDYYNNNNNTFKINSIDTQQQPPYGSYQYQNKTNTNTTKSRIPNISPYMAENSPSSMNYKSRESFYFYANRDMPPNLKEQQLEELTENLFDIQGIIQQKEREKQMKIAKNSKSKPNKSNKYSSPIQSKKNKQQSSKSPSTKKNTNINRSKQASPSPAKKTNKKKPQTTNYLPKGIKFKENNYQEQKQPTKISELFKYIENQNNRDRNKSGGKNMR